MNTTNEQKLSRRNFLRKVNAGVAATCAFWLLAGHCPSAYASGVRAQGWAMLVDLTRCTGCNSCALACKKKNGLANETQVPTALASDAYTFVDIHQVEGSNGEAEARYVKRQCMHCLNAACVAACPAAAMYKREDGPVVYRPERCLGCRYCQLACPFGIPRFDWDDGISPEIRKCWFCYDRLQEGEVPACVEACPNGALRVGRRDDLLAQAHARIASNPGRYIDHIYGEFEVGGTSVLYLSDVPFEEVGFRTDLPQTAPPEETEKIMTKLPYVIGGVATLMTATAVYTHRGQPGGVSGNETDTETEISLSNTEEQ